MTLGGLINSTVEWNLDYLDSYGTTVLWLTIQRTKSIDDQLTQVEARLNCPSQRTNHALLVPLVAPEGLARSEAISQMVNRARHVATEVAATTERPAS